MIIYSQQKPTIFISSTVYDFRDLRGSLKYYLEQLGYVVNMSEFNDFQREPDANSYEACLQTVRQADYFILLIGSRAGGTFTKASNATITQQEYRTAYEGAKAGRTRILTFVRRDVWTVKDDRDELVKLLKEQFATSEELSPLVAEAKIAKHASKFVTNAEHIFSFIDEVCRTAEMKAAIAGHGALPPSNWVHQFETFGDIIDCLRVQFNIEGSLEHRVLLENLKSELLSNLTSLLHKNTTGDDVRARTAFTLPFRQNYALMMSGVVQAQCKHVLWMLLGVVSLALPSSPFRFRMIERSIDLGAFLSFDNLTGEAIRSIQHETLEALRRAIDRYLACDLSTTNFVALTKKYRTNANSESKDALMDIECNDFAPAVNAANIMDEIYTLSKALYLHLDGKKVDFENLQKFPRSPFPDHEGALADEAVSSQQAVAHILST